MFKSILAALVLLSGSIVSAQNFTLHGKVYETKTGNPLPGATVLLGEAQRGTISDESGNYQLTGIPAGTYTLSVKYVGYQTKTQTVTISEDLSRDIALTESTEITEEVIIYATRATTETPTTFTNVDKETIQKQNFGQDLPYLLNWTPSLVTTSDAGTGFGYTGLRIRGSDATSINVTINGIPYNDSESLGTFWVDIPDIAASSESIQIQRGVGTSTNGAGAFGATINMQTTSRNTEPYAIITNSLGLLGNTFNSLAYNSRKHSIGFGTGLLKDHWVIDGRFSQISSEGFIDRSDAELGSYYLSAGFFSNRTMIKAIAFGGKERTHQAWYGVPESRLKNNEEAMLVTAMNEGWNEEQTQNLLNSNSRTFNPYTYKNQVDDYRQDHYQLHFSHQFPASVTATVALHYTPGKGFYEEYKPKDEFSDYGLDPVIIGDSVIEEADIIRRRWLDNDFGGMTFSVNYVQPNWTLTVGGGANRYSGKHFGEIIWAEVTQVPTEYQYYYSTSEKNDLNIYSKFNYQLTEQLSAYLDLQGRFITYKTSGIDNGENILDIDENFEFFNPKIGFVYQVNESHQIYSSASMANREPVRSDFINAPNDRKPKAETLYNLEAGYRLQTERSMLNGNFYFMDYHDQLIHTGRLNDVGAAIRSNVDKSFRMGVELETVIRLSDQFTLLANATLSRNKIKNFTETLYDYGTNWDDYIVVERAYKNTDIAFSPDAIAGLGLTYKPLKQFEVTWLSKYVGRQYLDNTANKARSLDPYFVNDLRFSYVIKPSFAQEISLNLMANNILNESYESNGYTWGYLGGGDEFRENYYFPQAGRSFMAMLSLKF